MGAGKWKPDYNRYFKDRAVILVPDNDEQGREHSKIIADNLKDISRSIKILQSI
jgi:5S rRNA maturation endonuclease (ribonuclease M5)